MDRVVADLVWHPLVPEGAGNRQRILSLAARGVGIEVHLIGPGPAPRGVPRFVEVPPWRAPRTIPWFNPGVLGYLHPSAAGRMVRAARALGPALVLSEGLWTLPAARAASRTRCPLAVTVNNIEHIVLASRGKRRWSAAVRVMERSWYRQADLLIAASPADGRRLRDLLGPSCPPVEIVPNGVDPPPAEVAEADLPHPNVVFLGKTDYPPNADAIAVLQREWLPEARRRGLEATAVVAGGPALPGVREGMVFTGYVEDVWPVISAADVCVAPLTAGSGTRLKVLTYLAAAKPVIATGVAVEGLGMEPGIHYLRAESGEEFAEALGYLRRDPGVASRLAARGRALSAEFSWATIGAHWSEVLRSRVGH